MLTYMQSNSMRCCHGRSSSHAALQFHLCGLGHTKCSILVEEGRHVQLLGLRSIEETQCLGCFATTRPLQGQEGEVATYHGPGLEFETAGVSPFSLGLVEISKWLVYFVKLVHGHFPGHPVVGPTCHGLVQPLRHQCEDLRPCGPARNCRCEEFPIALGVQVSAVQR